jgi:DNA-binding beta-propeller fold protein YncE
MRPTVAVAGILLVAACDTGGPSFDVPFPFDYLQDVDTDTSGFDAVACDFMSPSGSAIAAAGSCIFFMDHEMGYVLALIDTGYPIDDICATAEGGFAAAVSGHLLIYVSDGTYAEHDPVLLPEYGFFVVAKPEGNVLWVVCSDGSVQTVSTVTWQVSSSHATAVSEPVAAAADVNGSRLYVADAADGTVKTLSTSDFSLVATESLDGGAAADLCASPLGGVWVARHSEGAPYQLWHLDSGTGLHDQTVPVQYDPVSVAVTPGGSYFFVGHQAQTIVYDDAGNIEASDNGSYSPAADMAISGDGDRSVVCQTGQARIWMLQKS